MHRLQDLVRLHRQGLPARAIARVLRMGRNTVARYSDILRAEQLLDGDVDAIPDIAAVSAAIREHRDLPDLPRQQQSSIERWLPIIDAKFDAGVGPTAIYDFLRLEHDEFDGSLSAVKRRCAARRRLRGVQPGDVAIRVETDAGDVA